MILKLTAFTSIGVLGLFAPKTSNAQNIQHYDFDLEHECCPHQPAQNDLQRLLCNGGQFSDGCVKKFADYASRYINDCTWCLAEDGNKLADCFDVPCGYWDPVTFQTFLRDHYLTLCPCEIMGEDNVDVYCHAPYTTDPISGTIQFVTEAEYTVLEPEKAQMYNERVEFARFIRMWLESSFAGNRRHLHQLDSSQMDNCQNVMYQIDFEISGESETHLSFTIKPQCKALDEESCNCPVLSIDSIPDLATGNLNNNIHILTESNNDKKSLILGLFPLNVIVDAFTTASVKSSGTKYDLLQNNCASFLISIGLELGIDPANKEITSFVADQISTEFVMNQFLEEIDGTDFTKTIDSNNFAVAVEEFISNYVQERI